MPDSVNLDKKGVVASLGLHKLYVPLHIILLGFEGAITCNRTAINLSQVAKKSKIAKIELSSER